MPIRFPLRLDTFAALVLTLAVAGCGDAEGGEAMPGNGASDGSLGEPTAVFPEDFGAIQTVRELDDGTVLVADPLGGALFRVDLDAGTRTQVGSEGQGPQEYQQPDAVWPLPGDSTLLVDLGNGRMVGLGPDLSFGPTSPLSAGDPRSGLVLAIPSAVDGDGLVYTQGMGGGMGGQLPDSGAVLRIDRATFDADTVAFVKLSERIRSESGSGDNRSVNISQVPLSLEDAWGAGPDGSVVVARSSDYHVEWFRPDGSVITGPQMGYQPGPLGNAEKQAWIDSQGRTGGGLMIGVSVTDGGAMEMSFGRGRGGMGGGAQERTVDDYTWPQMAPPFFGDRIRVDPAGRAWVRRFVEAGQDTMYDVFDGRGEPVATYTLDGDRRVVGFGDGSVYVVGFDEFDLNYLERYALPG